VPASGLPSSTTATATASFKRPSSP
jgi:hypothetical protein